MSGSARRPQRPMPSPGLASGRPQCWRRPLYLTRAAGPAKRKFLSMRTARIVSPGLQTRSQTRAVHPHHRLRIASGSVRSITRSACQLPRLRTRILWFDGGPGRTGQVLTVRPAGVLEPRVRRPPSASAYDFSYQLSMDTALPGRTSGRAFSMVTLQYDYYETDSCV